MLAMLPTLTDRHTGEPLPSPHRKKWFTSAKYAVLMYLLIIFGCFRALAISLDLHISQCQSVTWVFASLCVTGTGQA
jgi:hypothetical protein